MPLLAPLHTPSAANPAGLGCAFTLPPSFAGELSRIKHDTPKHGAARRTTTPSVAARETPLDVNEVYDTIHCVLFSIRKYISATREIRVEESVTDSRVELLYCTMLTNGRVVLHWSTEEVVVWMPFRSSAVFRVSGFFSEQFKCFHVCLDVCEQL